MQATDLAELHHNRGGAHKIAGRLKEAEAEFRAALAIDPTRAVSRYALGITLLGQGRYPEGFPLFEYRHAIPEFKNVKPSLPFPEWLGEDVRGAHIAIWPEQGFGDQIQAARFAPVLKSMGAQVTLFCSPALFQIFQRLDVRVIAASGSVEFPDPDGWVMCGSIAGRLGVTIETIPAAPYLKTQARPRPSNFRVGLVTRGNPQHVNDKHRSLNAADAARLQELPAEIISLHPEDSGARDFAETAELIESLDLVISVDTAVAHLAGAMGKACWVLLPAHNTDWRWLEGRMDSPWYPSIRLFRQEFPGVWKPSIDQIAETIPRLVESTQQFEAR